MSWTKRKAFPFVCPSGNTVMVRRLGPDFALKSGRVGRILQRQAKVDSIEAQLSFLESLPDDELEKLMAFGREVLADCVVEPTLSLKPKEGQLSPDDVPLQDFWALYTAAANGFPDIPVQLKEGETTVDAVTTFPSERVGSVEPDSDSEAVQ